uniref:Uncharacterized protein n=1 Tax=Oryza barthii TaxID=65489 RepID=A0A0D3FRH2_9ORYZ
MNFGVREQRAFARMPLENWVGLIKGKSVVLTCLASFILLVGGSINAPKTCTGGMFLGPIIAIGFFLIVIFVVGSRTMIFTILLLLVFIIFGYVAVGGIVLRDASNGREYNPKECKRGWLRGRVTHSQHF